MSPSGDPVGNRSDRQPRPSRRETLLGRPPRVRELAGKSSELVREMLPSTRRVAALADPKNSFTKPFLEQIQLAARTLGIEIKSHLVRGAEEFDAAFLEMAGQRVDAVIVQPTLPRKGAIDLALRHRLPAVSGNRAFADAGGLLSYAARSCGQVSGLGESTWTRFLKGSKPAEPPVQQPTRFELVINLKTAKAIGITIHRPCSRAPTR